MFYPAISTDQYTPLQPYGYAPVYPQIDDKPVDVDAQPAVVQPIAPQVEPFAAPRKYEFFYPEALNAQVHTKTELLLKKAGEIAQSKLPSKAEFNAPRAVAKEAAPMVLEGFGRMAPLYIDARQDHYFTKVEHHHHTESESSKEKDAKSNDGMRLVIFLVGIAVAGFSAYCFGKAVAKNEEAQEKDRSFETLEKHWQKNGVLYQNNYDYFEKVELITEKACGIIKREKTDRNYNIALAISSIATGSLWAGGAIVGGATAVAMLTPGLVVGGIASVMMLGRYGYRSFSTKDKRDAEIIAENMKAVHAMKFNLPAVGAEKIN